MIDTLVIFMTVRSLGIFFPKSDLQLYQKIIYTFKDTKVAISGWVI